MSKISKDGLEEVTKQIKNPLESIYGKFERKGSLRWSDVKEEYDFIYKFLDNMTSWEIGTETKDPDVMVNGKPYKVQK
tara:strand:- start:5399 stop:5632 length:234 start_codon:yes stop_codon:yes gene_type:complete